MCSLLLRPTSLMPRHAPPLTLLVGLALHTALKEIGIESKIKWPNDLYIDQRKCAGILTEMSTAGQEVSKIIVGVGVNINERANLSDVNGVALGHRDASLTKWSVLDGFLKRFGVLWPEFEKKRSLGTHAQTITNHLLGNTQMLDKGGSPFEVRPLKVLQDGALHYLGPEGKEEQTVSGELRVLS